MVVGDGGHPGIADADDHRLAPLRTVCSAAGSTLPADGAWIALMTPEGFRGMVCASDDVASRMDELQFTLGEGPAVDAFAGGHPVLVDDLTARHGSAWPAFATAALGAGVRALYVFPLCIGAIGLGVLGAYRIAAGALTGSELARGLRLADTAAYAMLDLLNAAAPASATDGLDGPRRKPLPRADQLWNAEVHQASGIVMTQLGVPIGEALARIRAHAFTLGVPIGEVARAIVARTLRLER